MKKESRKNEMASERNMEWPFGASSKYAKFQNDKTTEVRHNEQTLHFRVI